MQLCNTCIIYEVLLKYLQIFNFSHLFTLVTFSMLSKYRNVKHFKSRYSNHFNIPPPPQAV